MDLANFVFYIFLYIIDKPQITKIFLLLCTLAVIIIYLTFKIHFIIIVYNK